MNADIRARGERSIARRHWLPVNGLMSRYRPSGVTV